MPKSIALLVGVSDYDSMPKLANPGNDANDLTATLAACGFHTTACINPSIVELDEAFDAFIMGIDEGDVALFFFAGHGVQIDGQNFLLAKDTPSSSPGAAKYRSMSLDLVIDRMTERNGATTLIVLDACRNNPWAHHRRGGASGLAPVYAPKGTLIAFSTSPGEEASDGVAGSTNGAYTSALLSHISTADLPVEQMFKRVRNTLAASTAGGQTSWEHTSLAGEFYFALGVARRITEYGAVALKDSAFVPDPTNWSHSVISRLKSYTWNTQNTAIGMFTVADANISDSDDLFILGRNILQAADGSSNSAKTFLSNFSVRTAGMSPEKRKALLDGVLFEIFFDSNGEFRKTPKDRQFVMVFELQRFPELGPSFAFIADALAPFGGRFLASPPGRGHAQAVDVRLLADPAGAVQSVILGGIDRLHLEDEDYEGADRTYRAQSRDKFETELSRQLLIPRRDLTITYGPGPVPEVVRYPYGYGVSPHTVGG